MEDQKDARIAVVAGGGSGIGRGCALRLAALGFQVTLVGRTRSKLDRTRSEILASGGRADCYEADVRDWGRLEQLGTAVAETGVDLVVNCAGGQKMRPSSELSREEWQSVVDINLSGSFFLLRHLYAGLAKSRGSAVTIVANMWQMPSPGLAHSAAARAGVVNLTRTLAKEWASEGIRVNAVAPGLTDSGALEPRFAAMVDRVPLGRIGKVDDVVDAVLFFATASYVTGEVLAVDGGIRLAA